jgi:GNAT superfamily N-acetyltransferase
MPDFEVREVDVDDEAQLHAWWQVSHDGATAGRPYDLYATWELARVAYPDRHPDWDFVLLSVHDDGRVVGAGLANMPLADNLSNAYLEVYVPDDERRRGVGTALLAGLEAAASSRGRTVLVAESFSPPEGSGPGEPFALARGYSLANREGVKVLDLKAHVDSWAALDDDVADRIGGYRIVEWGGTTPEEHVQDVCDSLNRFIGMIPTGDLEMDDLEYTPERLRRNEQRNIDLGTARLVGAALAPDGTLAGYHDLYVDQHRRTQARVGITMVLPEHRGHALGLGTKLATHRSLVSQVPECRIVATGNADVNAHMNSVNERMGYQLVEQLLEFQKKA